MSFESQKAMEDINAELGIQVPAAESKKMERDAAIDNVMDILKEGGNESKSRETPTDKPAETSNEIPDTSEGVIADLVARNAADLKKAREALDEIPIEVDDSEFRKAA